jgi:hypothetical protein
LVVVIFFKCELQPLVEQLKKIKLNMKKGILIFFIGIILSSCAFHSGNISSGPVIDCPMKDIVTGEASTVRLFGLIGGFDRNGLILEAKRDLYSKYKIGKNFRLTNFSVDFKTSFVLFYSVTKATVSADLHDCDTSVNSEHSADINPMIGGLCAGDSIIYEYGEFYKGQLKKHAGNGNYIITFQTLKGKIREKKVNPSLIYKTSVHTENKSYFGHNIGETVYVEVYVLASKTKVMKPCRIVGLNRDRLLISYIKDDGMERILSVEKNKIKE